MQIIQTQNKKAVSALVATVLVILITLAAFGVVYAYIMPLISSGMETSQACSDVKVSVNTHKGYTCFDSTTGEVRIQVSRENDEQNVTELQLKISGEGESETVKIAEEGEEASGPIEISSSSPGLVALWHMNEGEGAIIGDATDNDNDGTVSGATWTSSGKFGGAYSFDGVDDLVTTVGNINIIDAAPRTAMAWFYQVDDSTAGIVYWGTTTGASLNLLALYSGVHWGFYGNGQDCYLTSDFPSTNTWHHIANSYDGTTLKLYLDGIEKKSCEVTLSTDATVATIGHYPGWGAYTSGSIDEVAIWNRALSPTEILQIYEGTTDALEEQPPQANSEKTYSIDASSLGLSNIESASVAAVVKIGDKEHVCGMMPDVQIPEC